MNKINVVGFDPSFRNFGVAHATVDLSSNNHIDVKSLHLEVTEGMAGKTVRKNSDDLRCARQLQSMMMNACEGMQFAMIEIPSGTQSARASWALGVTLGVIASCPIPIIQVTPAQVKMASVGRKTASKGHMIGWAIDMYPGLNWLMRKSKGVMVPMNANEHLADAVAVLHAGVGSDQFKEVAALLASVQSNSI